MLVGGVGSYSGVQAFGGILASAAASLTGINAASLSTLRSAIVNQVASMAEISATSLSTLRNLIVNQVSSLAEVNATSQSALRDLSVANVASVAGFNGASLSTLRDVIVNNVASLASITVGSLQTAGIASIAALIVGSTAGVVTVNSNAVTATVSTPRVTAAGAILATVQQSYGASVLVASKVAGVSFAVQLTGSADANNAYSVAWALMN